jgi:hypothetical protein
MFGGWHPRQLAGFVRATLRHPWWLAGMACSTIGFALHALALHTSAHRSCNLCWSAVCCSHCRVGAVDQAAAAVVVLSRI